MPKRNPEYMSAQRDHIAGAAMTCLTEKGLYATSLRDICAAAGVSMGAFYVHFSSKEEVVQAALIQQYGDPPECDNWADFEGQIRRIFDTVYDREIRQKVALGYQIAAEMALSDFPKLSAVKWSQRARQWYANCFTAMAEAGEISPPLGIDAAIAGVSALLMGASYGVTTRHVDLTPDYIDDVLAGVALLAGRVTTQS